MTLAVKRLIRDLAGRLPELAHVEASRVLVVAGEARGSSRATIRGGQLGPPRAGGKRRFLRLRGRDLRYVITLRPLWFLASTAEERVATLLHELYHASIRFDGSLHRERRHARLPRARYDRHVQELLRRYLAAAPPELVAPFSGEGVVKIRMWLRGPRAGRVRGAGRDAGPLLFHGYMPLRTRAPREAEPEARPRRRRRGRDEEEGE
ncbi:hypothetical protein AMYX_42780 [Anaeromyxobacter diazotrophicus]|uniref:Putative phage metallopeptidase domain-containing protein n=2 Tax=Anaeromyxobacter diazotrophicus TaxID=2590199 RepID=A0A7I9VU94_9BACT|nr:hypothetical protein AMYX_42780 [Anaeromyxobacter diazotrophicus]